MTALTTDIRYATRTLLRTPLFTAAAVATVAIGIGMNASIFTIAKGVLFEGRPVVPNGERVAYIQTPSLVSYSDFEEWRDRSTSFSELALVGGRDGLVIRSKDGVRERASVCVVSSAAFSVLGVAPLFGRSLVPSDFTFGSPTVAILGYDLWSRLYPNEVEINDQALTIDGVPTAIVGVMPKGFSFPDQQMVWTPLIPGSLANRAARDFWFAFGRLKDEVSLSGARSEMDVIGPEVARLARTRDALPAVVRVPTFIVNRNAPRLLSGLLGAVALLLLIACTNLAGLMLTRGTARRREIGVRLALGATRGQIVRQLVTESAVVATAGGAFGLWIATWTTATYVRFGIPTWKQPWFDFSVDLTILAYVAAVTIAATTLFGLLPALRSSHVVAHSALTDNARGIVGSARMSRTARTLFMAQVTIAVVLLAGAGATVHSFLNVFTADLGIQTRAVVVAHVYPRGPAYENHQARSRFFDGVRTRLADVGGVTSVALATSSPATNTIRVQFQLEGHEAADPALLPRVGTITVSQDYFRTVGGSILIGRDFASADTTAAAPVAIVNARFAAEHWPRANPIGRRLRLFSGEASPWLTVVGVATDIMQNDSTLQAMQPLVYRPLLQEQTPQSVWIFVRNSTPSATLLSPIRAQLIALDPDPPDTGPLGLSERLQPIYHPHAVNGALFGTFGLVALLLTCLGIYAMVALSVSRRTAEIAVRMAVGASRGQVMFLILKDGLWPFGFGCVIGLAATYWAMPILRSQLIAVDPLDVNTLGGITLTLAATVILASALPGYRAVRTDPATALRQGAQPNA